MRLLRKGHFRNCLRISASPDVVHGNPLQRGTRGRRPAVRPGHIREIYPSSFLDSRDPDLMDLFNASLWFLDSYRQLLGKSLTVIL